MFKTVAPRINKGKTKYMISARMEQTDRIGQNVTMVQYKLERVWIPGTTSLQTMLLYKRSIMSGDRKKVVLLNQ